MEKMMQLTLFRESCDTDSLLKHTFGHVDCPACDSTRDRFMHDPAKIRLLPFRDAAEIWLDSRKDYLRPRTFKGLKLHVKNLQMFFGHQRPCAIHVGHLRVYQQSRLINADKLWAEPARASYINHEMVTMKGVMELAGEWERIKAQKYEPLPLPAIQDPKVMTDEEEMRLFAVASTNPDWQLAYWILSITCNSGASGCELRNLQLQDVHLDARIPFFNVRAETAKNKYRGRIVELNKTAYKQVARCSQRAHSLGSTQPDHYLFPYRTAPGVWNVTKPTTEAWLRRPMAALREAADLPWLTPHCLRHQHITLSYEAGEAERSIVHRVGHISEEMTRKYFHSRRATQKRGVDAIDPTVRFGPKSVGLELVKRMNSK